MNQTAANQAELANPLYEFATRVEAIPSSYGHCEPGAKAVLSQRYLEHVGIWMRDRCEEGYFAELENVEELLAYHFPAEAPPVRAERARCGAGFLLDLLRRVEGLDPEAFVALPKSNGVAEHYAQIATALRVLARRAKTASEAAVPSNVAADASPQAAGRRPYRDHVMERRRFILERDTAMQGEGKAYKRRLRQIVKDCKDNGYTKSSPRTVQSDLNTTTLEKLKKKSLPSR